MQGVSLSIYLISYIAYRGPHANVLFFLCNQGALDLHVLLLPRDQIPKRSFLGRDISTPWSKYDSQSWRRDNHRHQGRRHDNERERRVPRPVPSNDDEDVYTAGEGLPDAHAKTRDEPTTGPSRAEIPAARLDHAVPARGLPHRALRRLLPGLRRQLPAGAESAGVARVFRGPLQLQSRGRRLRQFRAHGRWRRGPADGGPALGLDLHETDGAQRGDPRARDAPARFDPVLHRRLHRPARRRAGLGASMAVAGDRGGGLWVQRCLGHGGAHDRPHLRYRQLQARGRPDHRRGHGGQEHLWLWHDLLCQRHGRQAWLPRPRHAVGCSGGGHPRGRRHLAVVRRQVLQAHLPEFKGAPILDGIRSRCVVLRYQLSTVASDRDIRVHTVGMLNFHIRNGQQQLGGMASTGAGKYIVLEGINA